MPIGTLTARLRVESALADQVMHELALIRGHWRKRSLGGPALDALDRTVHEACEFAATHVAGTADVEDEARERAGLRLHG